MLAEAMGMRVMYFHDMVPKLALGQRARVQSR
jgi:hypothetical protein